MKTDAVHRLNPIGPMRTNIRRRFAAAASVGHEMYLSTFVVDPDRVGYVCVLAVSISSSWLLGQSVGLVGSD